ncbi:MAG: T9SS type A sorting domain-containing protein [bacterium]|nr:T9SS type A sorting domain-containing protein [bacterium]
MKNRIKYLPQLLLVILFFSNQMFPQAPDTMWTKTFGGTNIDIGHCVQQTADSGYILTGYTRSYGTISGRNVWLVKTDKYGNHQWNNTFGGNSDDEGYSVQQTTDGGYIIAGYTESFGAGLNDVFLVKADASGNQVWTKTFGGAQDDEGYSVLQTNDGGFLIGGVTSSYGAGSRDMWMIKTDPAGNLIWQKTHGGLSSDGAWYVDKTSDGGFILTGWTLSYGPGFIGNAWLVKTDSLGNQQWNKFFGGDDVDRGYAVQQTTDGGYILTGYTDSFGAGLYDMLLIKTDPSGNAVWTKTFGGTGRDYGNSVQQTSDGGFIVLGYTLSFGAGGDDFYLVKTDANGNEEWFKTYGGSASDVGFFVRQTNDGGLIMTGHTLSFGAGVHDVWLIKTDNIIPVELLSFTAELYGNDVKLFWSTSTETNNSGFEILRFAQNNNNSWVNIGFVPGFGTTTEVHQYSFTDQSLQTGKYQYRLKQIDFDVTFTFSNIIEVTVDAPIIFSLEQNYPNPFNPTTKIKFSVPSNVKSEVSNVTLKIYDVLGNEVSILVNEPIPAGAYEIEFSGINLSSGIYFYQLKAGSFVETKKMVLLR